MKNFIFLLLFAVSIIACNSKGNQTENADPTNAVTTEAETTSTVNSTTSTEPVAKLYSCPMHPEFKGEKDDECPKCGMALTEPVK